MKASRAQLKALVKEIMVEILNEGLGGLRAESHQPVITGEQRQIRRPQQSFDPRLDTPINRSRPPNALKEAIKRESGGNSMMADIFADTAMTTLQTQLSHGDRMGQPTEGSAQLSPGAGQEQFHGDPIEVFGEASAHWADLAFMPSKKTA